MTTVVASPPTAVRVIPVEGRQAHRAFVELPYQLHGGDPCWVPPLRREESRRWDPQHNPSLRTRSVQRFLALRNGRVVGRIAAIVDRGFAERWEPDTGLFGFFECEQDPGSARALLEAAEQAIGDAGMHRLLGPVNLTFHDETGLLVTGFDSPPMVLSPWNPPWYPGLLVAAGYRGFRDYFSFRGEAFRDPCPEVEQRLFEARAGRGPLAGVQIRSMDLHRWDSEVAAALALYSATFESVWGFTPLTLEEFAERAGRMRPFIRPELVLFAERDGVPVGFGLTLPDVNRALAEARGRLWPFGWLRLTRMIPRLSTARFVLLGVQPGEGGKGVAGLLAWETAQACRRLGIAEVELSLVLADNVRIQRVIGAFGGEPFKTYRLYERRLEGADR